ncbi:hypothetical protein BUALT_Bualt03G0127000 [Buddleja alternifolia]|uniref:Uncharacterized protein n=1 Tax=Buddleja alternifolia TaxID=168488 RepID=A0AAV6Y169_9LAMI|nr:hypothetical protein BUALT_Bualt03G0122400 [Buddleja alternifolia]KAG8386227.1 hypothetical protein BUALT_Bualt03G0127000 [Buddleja alternifolia]
MGGGAMRAAAKVAGITVANGGLRGITSENYPVFSTARLAASARPAAASATAEDVKLVASQSGTGVQRSCSEMDDWVFAGGEEEAMVIAADAMPRVVFGGAPSLQEAREATSELTLALEKAYLSSPLSVGYEGQFVADNDSTLSISSSQAIVNKAVTSEIAVAPAVPARAVTAFRFLHESSVAQNVVASIACDPNVWNAVLQNQELQEFLQSQKTCLKDLVEDSDHLDQSSTKTINRSADYAEFDPDSGYADVVQKIKITVVDIMSSLSDYFQNFFGGLEFDRVSSTSNGTARLSGDTVMEASFMGLAVMAIMVIVLNRA